MKSYQKCLPQKEETPQLSSPSVKVQKVLQIPEKTQDLVGWFTQRCTMGVCLRGIIFSFQDQNQVPH
jgi:hypothetical protein